MASLKTVKDWQLKLDVEKKWLDIEERDGKVVKIKCKLCIKHKDRLKYSVNMSMKFINGITGSSLKKDNVDKQKYFSNTNSK